jgi:hypothetical protein
MLGDYYSTSPTAGGIHSAIVKATVTVTFLKAIQECSDVLPPLKLLAIVAAALIEEIQVSLETQAYMRNLLIGISDFS